MSRHRHARPPPAPLPAAAPSDRSWAARATALRRERPANLAMVAAVFAMMAAMIGWVAVLVPTGGDPRGSPAFWLLAIPLLCWTTPLMGLRAWAVNTVGLALLAAPLLALGALFAAGRDRAARLLDDGPGGLDTPGAMLVVLGASALLSLAGLVALRRSSLPGGTRPATFLPPGTLPPGVRPVSPGTRGILAVSSLAVSGTIVNGGFLAILRVVDLSAGGAGSLWPVLLPAGFAVMTLALVLRGTRGVVRGAAGAGRRLRRGMWVGMAGSTLPPLLVWLEPVAAWPRLVFALFMLPMALAATWAARRVSRRLREEGMA